MQERKRRLTQKQAEQEILRRMPTGPQIADSGVRIGQAGVFPQTAPVRHILALVHGLRIAAEAQRKWDFLSKDVTPSTHQPHAQDNILDAGRHAEWMYRTAREVGPGFAQAVGWLHELTAPNRPTARHMDEANNRSSIDAARKGRPLTWADLQTHTPDELPQPPPKPARPPPRPPWPLGR